MRLWKPITSVVLAAALAAGIGAEALAQAKKSTDEKASPKKAPAKKSSDSKKKTEERKPAEFEVQGTLGAPAKSDPSYFEFTYLAQDGKKKAQKKVWLKVDSGTTSLADRSVGMEAFKEGATLKVFGKVVDMETGGKGGLTGRDRRLQACRVVMGGKDLAVNDSYADPKDKAFKWVEAAVEKAGPSPSVTLDGASYKMSLDKGAAVLQRDDGDTKKDLRKGAHVAVEGATCEKPTGEKEDRPAYHASKVIVLEPRAIASYNGMILPQV